MSDDNNQQPAAVDADVLQRSIEALEAKNKELIAELRQAKKAPKVPDGVDVDELLDFKRKAEQQQLEAEEGEILLSREWRLNEGRLASRHRLNGVAVNRSQIQELRPLLLDLTVQGQTQQIGRAHV